MNNLRLVYVVGCGLFFSILGAFRLLSTFRTGTGVGPAGEPASESSEPVNANGPTFVRRKRISGACWLCLGVLTLAISSDPDSWGVPTLGVLWAAMAYFFRIRVGVSPAVVSQPKGQDGRLAEIVTQHVKRAFAARHLGLVVGAVARDEEILLGFGAREVGDSRPPDADTVFEIGSITKTFTGILLAEGIENGELQLDDRIAALLPEGWSLSDSAREITLRHCTTHTSGFPRLPPHLLGISRVSRLFVGGDPYRDYSEEEFREALRTVQLKCAPGTECVYSNFAAGLLGFVLARHNKSDYETLVSSKICQPLGMQSTAITNDEWHREQVPAKYRTIVKLGPACLGLESDEWQFPDHLAGAGAIRSTGRDMMTFLKANMGLIPTPIDAAIRRSHQEVFPVRSDRAMGMNWVRSFDSTIAQTIIWHNGQTGGFSAYLGFTEDRGFGVFVLSNVAITGADTLAGSILKALVEEHAPGSRDPITKQGSSH